MFFLFSVIYQPVMAVRPDLPGSKKGCRRLRLRYETQQSRKFLGADFIRLGLVFIGHVLLGKREA